MSKENLRMQMLAGLITESQYKAKLNEIITDDVKQYLEDRFEEELEGGDDYEEAPGETHIFTLEQDVYGDSEEYDDADLFDKAAEQLKNSPLVISGEEYGYGDVTFKNVEGNIIGSFTV